MKKQLLISFCILIFCFTNVLAQDGTITGLDTVKKDNLQIPGISVKIKGANNRVATYPKGGYSITIFGLSTLQFSFLVYTA
jgi:hypothetical protein